MLAAGTAAGVILATAIYVTAAPAAPAVPARIAVVDFTKVLQSYTREKDSEKTIKDAEDRIVAEAKSRAAELDKLKDKLKMHQPDSPAFAATEKEITSKTVEFQTWQELKQREMLERGGAIIRGVYADIERATADCAKAAGYTLVLKTDLLDLSSPSVRDLDLRVKLRQILYVSDELDITNDVVAMLNARYEKQKALDKPATPAPAPTK